MHFLSVWFLLPGGKPITPTGDQSLLNGSAPKDSSPTENGGSTVVDGVATKLEVRFSRCVPFFTVFNEGLFVF